MLNRSPETVLAAIKHARTLLPFPMLGLDTDNGGEFLNNALLAYCQQEQITFTRSCPECSNDNAYVGQKNGAVVRKGTRFGKPYGYILSRTFSLIFGIGLVLRKSPT